MKILLTGMTSSHTSKNVHTTNLGFFGNLELALATAFPKSTIVWSQPSVEWEEKDLDQYDMVFVGFVPPTALSANYMYGALKTISVLRNSKKLVTVLDHPELWQYRTALASIAKSSEYLLSSFYSKRKEYSKASKYADRLTETANSLLEESWGTVIYPALPWSDTEFIKTYLKLPIEDLTGVNLDVFSLGNYLFAPEYVTKQDIWTASSNNSWVKSSSKSQSMPISFIKRTKTTSDADIYLKLASSVGSIIPPSERNARTWWSHRYIQSLLAGVPVATEWKESFIIGSQWSYLPYQIEDMSPKDRVDLALQQKSLYLSYVGDMESIAMTFNNLYEKTV